MVTFGQMFGSVIFLPLADRYGRKKIMISVGFSMFLVATLISLSPNYYVYIAMKFLTGATLEVSKNLIWIIKKKCSVNCNDLYIFLCCCSGIGIVDIKSKQQRDSNTKIPIQNRHI